MDTSVSTVSDSAKQLLAETQDITASIEAIEQGVVQQAEDSEHCLRQMLSLIHIFCSENFKDIKMQQTVS